MATDETEPTRGFDCDCPACGSGSLSLTVSNLTVLFCDACEAEFTVAKLKRSVADLTVLIAWLETAPVLHEE